MATGRKTVVVGQNIDPVAWGNPLWDQSVQTFASAADRTAQFAAPKQGAVTWLEDVKRLEVYNGTAWVTIAPVVQAGYMTATTDVNGIVSIAHGLGRIPSGAFVQFGGTTVSGMDQKITCRMPKAWQTTTTVQVQFSRQDTGTTFGNAPVEFNWQVVA